MSSNVINFPLSWGVIEGQVNPKMVPDYILKIFFLSASVFSVSLDPVNQTLAVSGGEDDKAFVWKVADGKMVFECTGIVLTTVKVVIAVITVEPAVQWCPCESA